MIRFIKILEYELTPPSGDVFDHLCGVTSQEIDPPSLRPAKLQIGNGAAFASPLRRSVECVVGVSSKPVILDELKEIPFRLERLCSKEEWETHRSVIVRRRFKQAFEADDLMMKRGQIVEEIEKVLGMLKGLPSESDAIIVSHSFRLKLIEAFIKTKGAIRSNPELLRHFLFDDEKTYEFGTGFNIDTV